LGYLGGSHSSTLPYTDAQTSLCGFLEHQIRAQRQFNPARDVGARVKQASVLEDEDSADFG